MNRHAETRHRVLPSAQAQPWHLSDHPPLRQRHLQRPQQLLLAQQLPPPKKQSQPPQWQRHKLRRSCSVYCSRADARAVPAMQEPLNRTEQHKADKYPHPISPFRAARRPFSRHRPHGRDKRLAGFKIQLPYSVDPHARHPPRRDRRYGRDNPHSARRSPRDRLLITATETTARAEYAETTEEDKAVRREYALCLTICGSMRHALQSK